MNIAISGTGTRLTGRTLASVGLTLIWSSKVCWADFSDTNWLGINPSGANGAVNAVIADGSGNLYVGGVFTALGGTASNYIAQWNGRVWSSLGTGMNNAVHALAVSGNDLYAGGAFTMAENNPASRVAKWNGSAWSQVGPGLTGTIFALAVSGNDLYAAGQLGPANAVAKWDGTNWSAVGNPGLATADVRALALFGGELYAGGIFTTSRGSPGNYIARYTGTAWVPVGSGMNGFVFALVVSGNALYAGGRFTMAGGHPASYIAKWDGNDWTAVGAGLNGYVYSLAAHGGDIYVGGEFTTAGDNAASCVARWDGAAWAPLGSGVHGSDVNALATSAHSLYAGGIFDKAGGKPSVNVARAVYVAPFLPIRLQSPALAGGIFTAWLTNVPGASFIGLGLTGLPQSPDAWSPLGSVTEVSPGVYQFSDSQAASAAHRCYRLRWPD